MAVSAHTIALEVRANISDDVQSGVSRATIWLPEGAMVSIATSGDTGRAMLSTHGTAVADVSFDLDDVTAPLFLAQWIELLAL